MDDDAALSDLADRPFSYREIGATGVELPDGYDHLGRNDVVGTGLAAFRAAGECLMTWAMHRGAGLRVQASARRAATGVNVVLGFGPSWLPLQAPCRVVHTIEQADRVGFTYGTLQGHPISGEESFSVLLDHDDTVRLVIIAFTKPANIMARLGGPLGTVALRAITDRYVAAITEAASATTS